MGCIYAYNANYSFNGLKTPDYIDDTHVTDLLVPSVAFRQVLHPVALEIAHRLLSLSHSGFPIFFDSFSLPRYLHPQISDLWSPERYLLSLHISLGLSRLP